MDSRDAFFKLGFGAKFNLRRFQADAERLKLFNNLSKPKGNLAAETQSDFCNSNEENVWAETPTNESMDNDQQSDDDEPLRLTREIVASTKQEWISEQRSRKKRKKKGVSQVQEQRWREAIASFRKRNRIYIWGSDVPDPCPSFETMIDKFDIPNELAGTMRKALASWTPTPIQAQAIPIMMQRREILASAPTGSGKTLAFVLPLLCHLRKSQRGGFRALIIEPTRELAKQVYTEVMKMNDSLGLRVHMISRLDVAKEKLGPQSKRRLDILISTPNRLVHLLKLEPPCLDLSKIEWMIVDESDKLFETGPRGFRDQLAVIHQACDESRCRRAFFSATFSYDVEKWCKAYLDNVIMVSVGARNTAVETVKQELIFVGNEYGKLVALRNLISQGLLPPVLIFVQTKTRAQHLYMEMLHDKLKVDVIHSDRDRKEREKVVKRFRAGDVWFLICTELLGRGMDFKNVNVVINYDFPPSAISYIHRIGRTGRAGRAGRAVTFFTEYDRPMLRSIANVMREAGCPTPDYMLRLKKPRKRLQREIVRRCAERPNVTILRGRETNRKRRANPTSTATNTKKKRQKTMIEKESP